MSQTISPATSKRYGLQRVCAVWGVSRSSIYFKTGMNTPQKKGPKPTVSDEQLVQSIKQDLKTSPFKGEGHRKIHARLKRQGIKAGRNRILGLMRAEQLLSPHRVRYKAPHLHEGKISTEEPNEMWGSDGTKVETVKDGWVWIFSLAEHWNSECLGWHVCKTGDRFAALEPIYQGVRRVYGSLEKGIASGLKLRIDNGSQYTSDYFLKQLSYLGIESSFGLVRQPETNGVAERFHRTLKDQIVEGRVFQTVDEVREAVAEFVNIYNEEWLVAKLGYQSPIESRLNYLRAKGVA